MTDPGGLRIAPMHADDESVSPKTSLPYRIAVWVATGLGVGLATPAPGTVAGLWGLGLAAASALIEPLGAQLATIAVVAIAAAPVCGAAARALGTSHDPGAIVLDEIVALPIVFIGVPGMNWTVLLVGYALFRVCDILKPGLARAAEKLPGGWGIVADDCVAAVLACLLLHGVSWLDGRLGFDWLVTN
jgi:phosphatidylglycerophosphatase A